MTYEEAKAEIVATVERFVPGKADCENRGIVVGMYEGETMHWHCGGDLATLGVVITQGMAQMAKDFCGPGQAVGYIDEVCEQMKNEIRERVRGTDQTPVN